MKTANDLFRHFTNTVRKVTCWLIKTIANLKVFKDKHLLNKKKMWDYLVDFDNLMLRYEKQLQKHDNLTGPKMTFIDIIVFNEIETILLMYSRDLPNTCPKLKAWLTTLRKEKPLEVVNAKLFEAVEYFDLYAPHE